MTIHDCHDVRLTRERLDCGGFSTALERAQAFQSFVSVFCAPKRR
jgi:hypothetical protein